MARNPDRKPGRIGRPPAGAHEGEKVNDYPQLSLIASRPQWRLISDAIECCLRERPDGERRMVEELVRRNSDRETRH